MHVIAHLRSTARHRRKDLALMRAIGANESAHVLDDAEYTCSCLFAELDLLADVGEGYLLRGGHNDSAEEICLSQILYYGDMLIRGAWWSIDD